MKLRSLFLALIFLLGTACSSIVPTPILIGRLTDLNNETVQLYVDCSEGANFVPTKETCDRELLSTKIDKTMGMAVIMIGKDIKQPHGYDIYLSIAMIHFRIAERTLNDYTKAEQIARQFFEIQKAHSGSSISTSRFYWTWFAAATSAKQYYKDRISLDLDRKIDLLQAQAEGIFILNESKGPRKVRLIQALTILKFIISKI